MCTTAMGFDHLCRKLPTSSVIQIVYELVDPGLFMRDRIEQAWKMNEMHLSTTTQVAYSNLGLRQQQNGIKQTEACSCHACSMVAYSATELLKSEYICSQFASRLLYNQGWLVCIRNVNGELRHQVVLVGFGQHGDVKVFSKWCGQITNHLENAKTVSDHLAASLQMEWALRHSFQRRKKDDSLWIS